MTRPAPRPTLPILALCAAAALAPRAAALEPPVPDLAAAAAAGPASTAAYGARCIGPAHDDTPAFQAAIDTGHTVYAPAMGGHCHMTHALVMRTPGQIFHGDGRARTRIEIEPGFTGEGVFVAKTGEPGPVWRDFSVSFSQPHSRDKRQMLGYPPAFSVRDTPRFELTGLGCYAATTCIDMTGNSGGSNIADMQMSAFETGVSLDGSLDSVRMSRIHAFPFELDRDQSVAYEKVNWIKSGRVDGLFISDSTFFKGTGLLLFTSEKGKTVASLQAVDFDESYLALSVDGGTLTMMAGYIVLGDEGSTALHQQAGNVGLVGTIVAFNNGAKPTRRSPFRIAGKDASFVLSSSPQISCQVDMPIISVEGGKAVVSANVIEQGHVELSTPSPKFIAVAGAKLVVVGNSISSSDKTGVLVGYEDGTTIVEQGNMADGWTTRRKVSN